jgi:hypothetical protein
MVSRRHRGVGENERKRAQFPGQRIRNKRSQERFKVVTAQVPKLIPSFFNNMVLSVGELCKTLV